MAPEQKSLMAVSSRRSPDIIGSGFIILGVGYQRILIMADFSNHSASNSYRPEDVKVADAYIARGSHHLLIDGHWVESKNGTTFDITDPATGEKIASAASAGRDDVDLAVKAARRAFNATSWKNMDPHERSLLLHRIADLIESHAEELAAIQSRDLGANPALSRALVAGGVEAFRYYSGWPTKIFGLTFPSDRKSLTYSVREPLGVVGAIIPWNGPAQAGAWKIAPALACGNSVVFKAASEAPLVSLRMLELMVEAGVPAGVINMLTGSGQDAGQALVEHENVDKITFTGSTEVGKTIMAAAAKTLKKVTLELGGKSPTILFADADLEKAIPAATMGFCSGAGQGCVAGSRILVEDSIYDRVVRGIAEAAEKMSIGSAFEEGSDIPPIVSAKQLKVVSDYIKKGVAEGARLVTGGSPREGPGFFIEPTVFADVTPEMTICKEEIFGPVGAIMRFKNEAHAVTLANKVDYGLSASVWTKDVARMHRMMDALQVGYIWGNTIFEIDTKAPFGGYKQSGIGRELGPESIEAFTQVKTSVIRFESPGSKVQP